MEVIMMLLNLLAYTSGFGILTETSTGMLVLVEELVL